MSTLPFVPKHPNFHLKMGVLRKSVLRKSLLRRLQSESKTATSKDNLKDAVLRKTLIGRLGDDSEQEIKQTRRLRHLRFRNRWERWEKEAESQQNNLSAEEVAKAQELVKSQMEKDSKFAHLNNASHKN